jgi:hypothetical protein
MDFLGFDHQPTLQLFRRDDKVPAGGCVKRLLGHRPKAGDVLKP